MSLAADELDTKVEEASAKMAEVRAQARASGQQRTSLRRESAPSVDSPEPDLLPQLGTPPLWRRPVLGQAC